MSNAQHTPGPWIYAEFELYEGAGIRFNIAQADGAPFTPYYSDVANTIAGEVIEIQEANARLIAAAPELLTALHNLEVAANSLEYCYGNRHENFAACLQQLKEDAEHARQVQDKAKGSNPETTSFKPEAK